MSKEDREATLESVAKASHEEVLGFDDSGVVISAAYAAITKITGELARVGIAKGRKNQQQGYSFRGIDDVYSALAHLLAENNLIISPTVLQRVVSEYETKQGGRMINVALEIRYEFISSIDGSVHYSKVWGEAMDSADKATNKAMSAAYKTLCLQIFCVPTEGESPDADNTTHEIASKSVKAAEKKPREKEVDLLAEAKAFREKFTSAKSIEERVKVWQENAVLLNMLPAEVTAALKKLAINFGMQFAEETASA